MTYFTLPVAKSATLPAVVVGAALADNVFASTRMNANPVGTGAIAVS